MKVLVNFLGRKGAGPVYSFEMTKGLVENGCEVTAIIPDSIDNLGDWEELLPNSVLRIKTYSDVKSFICGVIRFIFIDQWKVKKILLNERFDGCYVPMIQPWALFISGLVKCSKVIVTLHDPIPHSGSNPFLNYLYKKIALKADELVILSEVFKGETCKTYHKREENVHVIPCGVFDYYHKFETTPIERTQSYNFLFFGRITKYKGLHILSEAYNRLYLDYKNISLMVVGSGDFSVYKEEFPEENNITVVNRYIDDKEVVSYFTGNKIITVLPYTDATQSGVVPIAMHEESLLIVTNTGGLFEQTSFGKYAIVSGTSSDDLYKAMKKSIDHYEDYIPMIKSAKEYVASLSWYNLSAKILEIIE